MTTFKATHSQDVRSTAVDTVTYNENTRELVLDWDGELYKYSGVPLYEFDALVNAPSVGRKAQEIKRKYGPSQYLGTFGEVTFVKDESKATFPLAAQKSAPTAASVASTPTFSLTPVPASNVGSEAPTFTVSFKANGNRGEHTPAGVSTLDEALAEVRNMATVLGVELTVTGVYVDYEDDE